MKHTGFSEWEMLLAILKDYRPHRNFDIPGEIKDRFYDPSDDLGMFPVAARIRTLREKKYQIKAGPPYEFNRETIRQKDHYYQLERAVTLWEPEAERKPEPIPEPEPIYKPKEEPHGKQLTMDMINKDRAKLEKMLA